MSEDGHSADKKYLVADFELGLAFRRKKAFIDDFRNFQINGV